MSHVQCIKLGIVSKPIRNGYDECTRDNENGKKLNINLIKWIKRCKKEV